MAGTKFGQPRDIAGKAVADKATLMPLKILRDLNSSAPIPISVSGSSNVVFNIAASVSNHVALWIGSDLFYLKESLSYTWIAGLNNSVLNSAGVVTASQKALVGVWYFYVGITDSTGAYVIYPSQTAPSQVEGPNPNGHFSHPGTTRDNEYAYVGFQLCSATTPTFIEVTKIGFTYNKAATAIATTSTWALVDFSETVPAHGALGLTVGGHVNAGIGASATVIWGGSSTAGEGVYETSSGITTTAQAYSPFDGITPDSAGKIWAIDTVARGDISITRITDVV